MQSLKKIHAWAQMQDPLSTLQFNCFILQLMNGLSIGMRKIRFDQDFLIEHWHMIYIMPVVLAEIYF